MDITTMECTFAIVGGGIAAVSCAEGLNFLVPHESVVLVSASPLIKAVTNIVPLGKTLMQYDVEERSLTSLSKACNSVQVLHDTVISIDIFAKLIKTENKKIVKYKKLCLCTGAKPKLIEKNDFVLGIRDTESLVELSQKVEGAKRVVVVGNGGIATELVHKLKDIEIIWIIKDKHISATFVDPGAAEFFLDAMKELPQETADAKPIVKRMRYTMSKDVSPKNGAALGPDWHENYDLKGSFISKKIQIEYECELISISNVADIDEPDTWPVYVKLTNGKTIGCNFVISATGVMPNSNLKGLENLVRAEDNGLLVDWKLETSAEDIYAAGDVCTAGWELAKHWFQMRLWTQAHQMGRYAAKSMVAAIKGEEIFQDFCFEYFAHVTRFFGYKVVLLGLYNGQKLEQDYEILLRMSKRKEYVKLVLQNGRLQGAVLIGNTDLEEMCENLILNQLDLSIYGEDILNPDIDIEDYFD